MIPPYSLTAYSVSSLKSEIEQRRTAFAFVLEDINDVLDFSADIQPYPRPMEGLLQAIYRGLTRLPDESQSVTIQLASPRLIRTGSAAGRLVRQSGTSMGRKHARTWNAIRDRLANRLVLWKLLEIGGSEKLDALERCCQHLLGFQPIPIYSAAHSAEMTAVLIAKQGSLSPCKDVIAKPTTIRTMQAAAELPEAAA
jgi:hypothetical protein